MVAFELEGVEIDRCLSCGGTWLDTGELEWIAEQAGVDTGPLTEAVHAANRGERGDLKCPRCGHRMDIVSVGDDPPVEIDRCRLEDGLWFDEGEMEKVVASFAEGEQGAVARFFGDLYRHDLRADSKGE